MILELINRENKVACIIGYFNINTMNLKSTFIQFLKLLYTIFPIDINCKAGIIMTDFSDYCIFPILADVIPLATVTSIWVSQGLYDTASQTIGFIQYNRATHSYKR